MKIPSGKEARLVIEDVPEFAGRSSVERKLVLARRWFNARSAFGKSSGRLRFSLAPLSELDPNDLQEVAVRESVSAAKRFGF